MLSDDVEGKFTSAFPGMSLDKGAFLAGLRAETAGLQPCSAGAEVLLPSVAGADPLSVHHAQLASASPRLKVRCALEVCSSPDMETLSQCAWCYVCCLQHASLDFSI